MPIYEYRCQNGHEFEVMQRITEGPPTECQVCGAAVERIYRAPAVHFKGSGFYNTDYGTRKRLREKEAGGGESGGGEKAAEKSSDSASSTSEKKSSSSESKAA